MKPVEIRLQNCSTGCGIEECPVICWKYEPGLGSSVQKSCRITIYDGKACIYDSGELITGLQNNHSCDCRLESHRRYLVHVSVVDERGEREEGEPYSFISGITQRKDWKGTWITNQTARPQYLGKEITIKKNITLAVLSVAGVGQYRLMIGGYGPDDSVLNGSWTDFNKHIHYRTWDITGRLKRGDNEVLIEVGNGWYCADTEDERHFYTAHSGYMPFGPYPAAIVSITLIYEDGEMECIGTDGTWWGAESETTYTNIYGSEDCDAGRIGENEKKPAVELDEQSAPKGKLVPMRYPPVKVIKSYQGILVKKLEDGGLLYDLGQNMSGLFEISVKGKRGTKIRIIPVEKVDVHGNPWRTTDAWCCYTLGGNDIEKWCPRFTYGAGRYVELCVDPGSRGKKMPEIVEVCGHFISSSARDTGSFYCSDHRYMQIHDLVLHAIESNLNHVHTDCPTIERLGWQEPNHLMGPSIFYVKEVETLWSKIAEDQRDSQYGDMDYDVDLGAFPHEYSAGLLPSIAPRYAKFLVDGGEGSFWDIIPWGSSILLAAYEQYRFTGNKSTLIANYETAKKYVEYLHHKYINYASLYHKNDGIHLLCHGLGDWGIEQNRGESRENIETAYFYRDLIILSQAAGWAGKEAEEKRYRILAENVLHEYNDLLLKWNPQTGEWAYDSYEKTGMAPTQTTQAIPLQFGMVPEEKKSSVQMSFLLTCEEHKICSGEIGLPYIFRTLGDLKRSDIVHDMLMQEFHPSYYRFIQMGETTLPEFWRDDSRSRNHDMMGAVLEWFYRYLAGISSEDGYRTIRIAPDLPGSVERVQCCYRAITGTVELDVWRDKEERLQVTITLPANTVGIVQSREKEILLVGGRVHHLIINQED